ncbi:MAG: endonuclease/exonuclease/phosphatase family protein [Bacillota bacterium]|jgi:endonuclease/exonuclease/phosphatase family metal-dependent hydrolase|nr:endonuclease/exonuclease/phosphatase family protein [Bacillota bacterium]
MRIGTLNIQRCKRASPQTIGQHLREMGVQLAVLQEVDRNTRRSQYQDQIVELREASGMKNYHFYRTIPFLGGGEYGIAVMTQNDKDEVRFIDLTYFGDREPRGAIILHTVFQKTEFLLVGTHLSQKPRFAKLQFRDILKFVRSSGLPWLIAGDLNLEEVKSEAQDYFEDDDAPTWPSEAPKKRFDHILCDNFFKGKTATYVHCLPALSDHCMVIADIFL